ncbi:TPA: hypothetical protein HA318_02555, partial [Candidatus Micrarchaeota archaeon]|nr:hypothetical protein [Candidatus Micrarchaeota archaeon]
MDSDNEETTELDLKKQDAAQKRKLAGKELGDLREKNRENISSFKQSLSQVKQEKTERDKENNAVAEFKERRDSLHKKAAELREQTRLLQAKFRQTGGNKTIQLRRRLEQLEYALHVEGANPRLEKQISAEMSELEKTIKASEANDSTFQEISAVRTQL